MYFANFKQRNTGADESESPGLVVMGGDSVLKVVGLNPRTIYWMDIFSHIFVVKIVVFVWKDENKRKKPGLAHF